VRSPELLHERVTGRHQQCRIDQLFGDLVEVPLDATDGRPLCRPAPEVSVSIVHFSKDVAEVLEQEECLG